MSRNTKKLDNLKQKIIKQLEIRDSDSKFQKKFKEFLILNKIKKQQINKRLVDKEIAKFNGIGITDKKRKPQIIVSLTSYPERIVEIHYVLFSLLNQTCKPDKIILWLGEEKNKFPNKDKDLPDSVIQMKQKGVEIKYVSDIRSYTKLIPALKEYSDDIIVTADDDIYYPKEWLEKLYNEYLKEGDKYIYCHRAHSINMVNDIIQPYETWEKATNSEPSYLNFLTGVGGVLYPPNSLFKDVLKQENFQKLSPFADDIWFWAMAVLSNHKIKVVEGAISDLKYLDVKREYRFNNESVLNNFNCIENGNDKQLKDVLKEYPEIYLKLKNN